MNEYRIRTTGRGIILQWFAESAQDANQQATEAGHRVVSVVLVRECVDPESKHRKQNNDS